MQANRLHLLTDSQVYALSRCSFLDEALQLLLKQEIVSRNLDLTSLEKNYYRIVHEPLPDFLPSDEFKIWVMATLMPLYSGGILTRIIFGPYFHKNPRRFQVYGKRSMLLFFVWCVVFLVVQC